MAQAAGRWWKYPALLLCLCFPLLAHFVLTQHDSQPLLRTLTLYLPLLALACWTLLRLPNKAFYLSIIAMVAAVIFVIDQHGRGGLAIAYGLPHAVAYIFLTWLFGRTLAGGREPLITRVARRMHGSLEPRMQRYTRNITIAWCVFFVLQLIASALLLAFAPLETWSLFVNILNAPLIVLMFAGEYIYRINKYPDHPRVSIARSWHEFARDARPSDANPR